MDKLRRASGRLAAALFAEPDRADPAAWRQQLTRLADEHDRLERQLAAAAGVPPRAAVSPAALAAVLPEKCALVDVLEYGQFEPQQRDGQWLWNVDRRLVAFVVRPGRPLTKVDLGPSRPVADAVEDWRKACIGRRTNGEIAGAKFVRCLVGDPLVKSLDGAETVLIAPDGPLTRVPFAALPGRQPGRDLIDEVAVAIVPVPQLLPELLQPAPRGSPPPGESLLLAGDINFCAVIGQSRFDKRFAACLERHFPAFARYAAGNPIDRKNVPRACRRTARRRFSRATVQPRKRSAAQARPAASCTWPRTASSSPPKFARSWMPLAPTAAAACSSLRLPRRARLGPINRKPSYCRRER